MGDCRAGADADYQRCLERFVGEEQEHARLVESEQRYKTLAGELESRVKAQVAHARGELGEGPVAFRTEIAHRTIGIAEHRFNQHPLPDPRRIDASANPTRATIPTTAITTRASATITPTSTSADLRDQPVTIAGLTRAETIEACADSIRALYADIDFPERFTPEQLPRQRVREIAERAVPGLYAGIAAEGFDTASVNDDTVIACPSARKMTVRQAQDIFERCLA